MGRDPNEFVRERMGIECPVELRYLVPLFEDVSRGRSYGPAGPCPLPCAEIAAWSGLTGFVLEPWEVQMIRRLDHVWLTEMYRQETADDA